MPCTYPMIPITISFFTKQAEQRGNALLHAAANKLGSAFRGQCVYEQAPLGNVQRQGPGGQRNRVTQQYLLDRVEVGGIQFHDFRRQTDIPRQHDAGDVDTRQHDLADQPEPVTGQAKAEVQCEYAGIKVPHAFGQEDR